ncbi:hypothetical protein CPB84DRAFT_1844893 [Gymnopilus junonius]|uniref:Uncharacterized protein n=1 Tax=Gymnopilus junonius TaxID=109634 RepID=A0A9P5NVM0_GYMJU|nr:hypothetical protein CPB84DRAFT_1844893 [Gymnopilus junonius]
MSNFNEDVPMEPPPDPPPIPLPLAALAGNKRKCSPCPGPAQAKSSTSAEVRAQSETSGQQPNDDECPPQRAHLDQVMTPHTKAAMKAKKQKEKKASDWHLTKKEVPWETKVTKSQGYLFSKQQNIRNLGRIPEPLLLYAFRVVASFGLPHWALDVLSQDPDSMYNLLHEYIALNTFEQLARKRVDKLIAEAFHNDFIQSVKEPAAHSDDEADDEADEVVIYEIGKVEGRSDKYTKFFHNLLDPRNWKEQRKRGLHKKQEQQHVVLHPPRASRFKGEPLPDRVSIDYFTPHFWNHVLSVEDKAHYIKDGVFIGMPPAYLCSSWKDVLAWKGLSWKEMVEKYG